MFNEKINGCQNNPENSSTKKVSEHTPSGFSISKISSFKTIKSKHDICRGKDWVQNICESIKKHAMVIISFKKTKLLTNEQQKSY